MHRKEFLFITKLKNKNFIRYVYLGFFNFIFITVVTYLNFEYLNLNENLSFIISISISFFINLLTLKYYVLRSNKKNVYLG
jgi:putative flippase GtrA